MDKPTKPTNLLPESFGGEKENFNTDKITNGYEADVPDILGGANLNYLLDAAGQNLKYANTIVDYINDIPVNNSIITDANNKLQYTQYDCRVYKSTETYGLNEWVTGIVGDKKSIYQSLVVANTGAPLTDTTKWQKVELGGGTSLPLLSIRLALYVDESLGLDYYLNGQLLTINSNLQGAVTALKSLQATTPSLFVTEEEWQATKTLSPNGIVNAFVLDEDAGTLRLPKYPDYIYGGSENAEISVSGNGYGLGLTPDGSNLFMLSKYGGDGNDTNSRPSGPHGAPVPVGGSAGAMGGGYANIAWGVHPDPAKSGLKGQLTDNTETITLKYVIRLATGQETEVNIRNDIESIVPYTLFDSKYSEAKQYNASWGLGGSILSKSVYPTAYEAALVEYNSEVADGTTVELPSGGSYTKRGVSGGITVKLSTDETVTEYDWKLDTVAETLTVPTLNGSEDLLSDRYDDLELKASGSTYTAPANGWFWIQKLSSSTGQYLTPVIKDSNGNIKYTLTSQPTAAGYDAEILAPVSKGDVISIGYSVGGATKSFRFIYAKSNGSLYFFVASVAQNAPLANLGRIEETKVDKNSSWGFPSNRYIDLELGASGSTYTAPANGWYYLQKKTGANNQYSVIFALKDGETTGETIEAIEYGAIEWTPLGNNGNAIMLKVPKGKKVVINYSLTGATELFRFIYAEGSN